MKFLKLLGRGTLNHPFSPSLPFLRRPGPSQCPPVASSVGLRKAFATLSPLFETSVLREHCIFTQASPRPSSYLRRGGSVQKKGCRGLFKKFCVVIRAIWIGGNLSRFVAVGELSRWFAEFFIHRFQNISVSR